MTLYNSTRCKLRNTTVHFTQLLLLHNGLFNETETWDEFSTSSEHCSGDQHAAGAVQPLKFSSNSCKWSLLKNL